MRRTFAPFNIFRLIGLSPISWDSITGWAPSTAWTIYTMVLTCIYTSVIIYILRDILPPSGSSLDIYAIFFTRCLALFSEAIRMFLACVHCKKLANILNAIFEMDAKYNSDSIIKFGHDKTLTNSPFSHRIWLQIVMGVLLLVVRIVLSPLLEPKVTILLQTTCCIAFWMQYMGCCQFCSYAYLLKDNFNFINQRLKAQERGAGLMSLGESHNSLCKVVENISYVFNVQMLLFNSLVFAMILVTLFNSIKMFVTMQCEYLDHNPTWANLVWVAVYVSVLFAVLQASVNLCSAANNITDSLHESANEIGVQGENVHQLRNWSMQMINSNIEIYVCGMFSLDYQVLLALISASASYLIIMVQFDEDNQCE